MKRLTSIGFTASLCVALTMWQQHPIVGANSTAMSLTFTVTNIGDSGSGSLRNALGLANSNPGMDTITFDSVVFATPQTITLTTGELQITDSVTISGPGANLLTISGNSSFRIFDINLGEAILSGMTIANGKQMTPGAFGGGIVNFSRLTLNNSTLSGNSANGVGGFGGAGGGIYNQGTVTLNNSTLSGNSANGGSGGFGLGGGIFNQGIGTVTITNSILSGNSATGLGGFDGIGGGIYNQGPGTVTITNSTVSGNSASGDAVVQGGGIYNQGTVILNNSTLSDNSVNGGVNDYGGGIYNRGIGTIAITNSTVSGNSVGGSFSGFGGGIYNQGTVSTANSILFRNSASGGGEGLGGGIVNANTGIVTLTNSTLWGNSATSVGPGLGGVGQGGGIFNWDAGSITLNNSTLLRNTANGGAGLGSVGFGGGIATVSGSVILSNSTLSGNSASGSSIGFGGGICILSGTLGLTNSTLFGNAANGGIGEGLGGGIFSQEISNARNTIIAGNTATTFGPDAHGAVTSQGHNLIGDGTGSSGFTGAGDQVGTAGSPINALLAPLGNNGGTTETHALLAGSPAINTGDNCVTQNPGCLTTPLTTDQRGVGFLRNSGGTVDIGAFEVQQVEIQSPPVGPGVIPDARSAASDQKAGSILIFNIYTSSPTLPSRQNTRLSITNTEPTRGVAVHLFFVDGSTCSVVDRFVCVTANQTVPLLASDQDPGTTGYLVAVAVDSQIGCPIDFNYLIGDEFVKFESGHATSLGAESISAVAGGVPLCSGNSLTATLAFDGVTYSRVGAVLASSSIPSRGDSNSTLLIVNRISGNLTTSASFIGPLFGVLYDEAEGAHSFILNESCQLRRVLDADFPRTTPRFETVVGAGASGWMKLWSPTAAGLLGAQINLNTSASQSGAGFNQGHNLHKLTLSTTGAYTIPVFPPHC